MSVYIYIYIGISLERSQFRTQIFVITLVGNTGFENFVLRIRILLTINLRYGIIKQMN